MGAETKEIRNSEAAMLLDYGFAKCKTYTDTEVFPEDFEIPVKGGVTDEVAYKPVDKHEVVLVDVSSDDIEKNIIVYEDITAPVREGDILGMVQYSYNGSLIEEIYIYADEDVEKMTCLYGLKIISKRLFLSE
jgi:D-alanyl-D-alanine carboxypeptidase (penicillin-binding protein 5/6)